MSMVSGFNFKDCTFLDVACFVPGSVSVVYSDRGFQRLEREVVLFRKPVVHEYFSRSRVDEGFRFDVFFSFLDQNRNVNRIPVNGG